MGPEIKDRINLYFIPVFTYVNCFTHVLSVHSIDLVAQGYRCERIYAEPAHLELVIKGER